MRKLIISLLMIICFGISTNAQEKKNKIYNFNNEQISGNSIIERKVYCNKLCVGSIATYGIGFGLDANSSWDKLEKNKIFINHSNDKFAFNKFSLVHGAAFTVTMLLQKKYPKAMTISRFFLGGVLIYSAIKNYSVNYSKVPIRCCVLKLGDGTNGRP